jgi:hypothetical protein
MKTNQFLLGSVVTAAALSANVYAAQMFPIVTNDTTAAGFSVACAGTNYLVGIKGDFVTNNEYRITAQLFGPAGTPVGARINPVPGHTQGNGNPLCPFVASSGTNFLLVWPDDYLNGPYSSVNGQIISPSGDLVGGWFAITTNSQQGFTTPEPVAYGRGEYLVVWDDYRNGYAAIYGQLISAGGAPVGTNFLIAAPVTGQVEEKSSTVAFDGTNFLVAWFNVISVNSQNVICGAFVSPSGVVGTPFAIGQAVSSERNPLYTVFNGTNYLVVWNFYNSVGSIYGRFVTPSGTFLGNEFSIETNVNKALLAVAFDGANYLFCSDVQCQFLNANGQPAGPQFTPFSAQGNEVPLFATVIYDGKQFVSVATLTADTNAAVYGAFIPASTTPPQFGSGASYGNSQFSLSLAGTPGINYAIQVATNLAAPNWTALVTNSPTNGTFSFTDTGATNLSRSYRAVRQ